MPERKVFSPLAGGRDSSVNYPRLLVLLLGGISCAVFKALRVHDRIIEALSALSSDFLKFPSVSINQFCPLAHLMACLFVEFSLVEVVLFL